LIDRDPDASPRAYPLANASERQLAHEFTDAILAAAEIALAADPDTTLARGAPKPAPEARIVPRS
jgi:hypothetical protein